MRSAPGPMAYDDCAQAGYCDAAYQGGAGICEEICDPNAGVPVCPAPVGSSRGFTCTTYNGLFGAQRMTAVAGICDPA
jgi:hypothetical protein